MENPELGHVLRPHCVQSVLTTSVKILPYRPPARRLTRTKQSRAHLDEREGYIVPAYKTQKSSPVINPYGTRLIE